MSERIMTLFGEEIVPEPEKPAVKTRAKKTAKEITTETPSDPNDRDQNLVNDLPLQIEKAVEAEKSIDITKEGPQESIIPETTAITGIVQTVPEPEEKEPEVSGGESQNNEREEEKTVAQEPQDIVMPDEPVAKTAHDKPKQKKTIDKQPIAEKSQQADDDEEENKITVNKKSTQANLPDDWEGDKQYYSIGEVATLFKVKTSHIRFWTNEFKLKVRTNRKGDRLYTPAQIKELRAIHHLVKERGFTLSGAKAKMKTQNKMDVETIDLKQSLIQLRSKLLTIKNQLK